MTEIALLCDQSETEELGIRLTADQLGIDLELLPFHKTAFAFDHRGYSFRTKGKKHTRQLRDVQVIINRCQSKNRRLNASAIFESIGKYVLNPQSIENYCHSKLRTLLAFARAGIQMPKTVYVSANVQESIAGGPEQDNTELICNLLEQELSDNIVVKPDAGTHGKGVRLAGDRKNLHSIVQSVRPEIMNPSGILAQEFVKKWFFDMRILVSKKKGELPSCHVDALARCSIKDFRTNTYLGNMVCKTRLPEKVRKDAEICAGVLGENHDAWVIALDAMPRVPQEMMVDELQLKQSFDGLKDPFAQVTRVKKMQNKKSKFIEYSNAITDAYRSYMDTESYEYLESVVNGTLSSCAENVFFHEGSACPEFWEQTRVVAGINVAEDLLGCARSLIDR